VQEEGLGYLEAVQQLVAVVVHHIRHLEAMDRSVEEEEHRFKEAVPISTLVPQHSARAQGISTHVRKTTWVKAIQGKGYEAVEGLRLSGVDKANKISFVDCNIRICIAWGDGLLNIYVRVWRT
jgi:hypothetical protein